MNWFIPKKKLFCKNKKELTLVFQNLQNTLWVGVWARLGPLKALSGVFVGPNIYSQGIWKTRVTCISSCANKHMTYTVLSSLIFMKSRYFRYSSFISFQKPFPLEKISETKSKKRLQSQNTGSVLRGNELALEIRILQGVLLSDVESGHFVCQLGDDSCCDSQKFKQNIATKNWISSAGISMST